MRRKCMISGRGGKLLVVWAVLLLGATVALGWGRPGYDKEICGDCTVGCDVVQGGAECSDDRNDLDDRQWSVRFEGPRAVWADGQGWGEVTLIWEEGDRTVVRHYYLDLWAIGYDEDQYPTNIESWLRGTEGGAPVAREYNCDPRDASYTVLPRYGIYSVTVEGNTIYATLSTGGRLESSSGTQTRSVSYTDSGGLSREWTYDVDNRLIEMRWGVYIQRYTYDIVTGDLRQIAQKTIVMDGQEVREIPTVTTAFRHVRQDPTEGDYVLRRRQTRVDHLADTDGGSHYAVTIHAYYGDTGDNRAGLLKYIVSPEGVRRFLEHNGFHLGVRQDEGGGELGGLCDLDDLVLGPDGDLGQLTPADLAFYAETVIFDYDDMGNATQIANGSGGCCASLQGVTSHEYGQDTTRSADWNDWQQWRRTVHPSGLRTVELYNRHREPIFHVEQEMDGGSVARVWITHRRYYETGHAVGRLEETRFPSACTGYAPQIVDGWVVGFDGPNAIDDAGSTGLVQGYEYDEASGNYSARYIREGTGGEKQYVWHGTYARQTSVPHAIWRLASSTQYDPAVPASQWTPQQPGLTVTWSYTWYDGTDVVEFERQTLPAVGVALNGSGLPVEVVHHYHQDLARDLYYNDWTRDADGTFSYTEMGTGDWNQGRVIREVRDVVSGRGLEVPSAPQGWTAWSLPSTGLHLVTEYAYYDDPVSGGSLGLLKSVTVDAGGSLQQKTLYAHMSRRVVGFHSSGCYNTHTTTHRVTLIAEHIDGADYSLAPVRINVRDLTGASVLQASGVAATGTDGNLVNDLGAGWYVKTGPGGQLGIEEEGGFAGTLVERTEIQRQYDAAGALAAIVTRNWVVAASSDTADALETVSDIDPQTRREYQTTDPDGTIRRMEFDQRGRLTAAYQGRDLQAMHRVSELFYDEDAPNGVGDGYVTRHKAYAFLDETAQEETSYETLWKYDFRGVVTAQRQPGGILTQYIVQGDASGARTETTDVYANTHSWNPSASNLRSRQERYFDSRGRLWQEVNHEIGSGGVPADTLVMQSWYDDNAMLIRQSDGAGMLERYVYDIGPLGPVVISYVGYDINDEQVVIAQTRTLHDRLGRPIQEYTYERHDGVDDTVTGPLSVANARVSLAVNWYDALDRLVRSARYGALTSGQLDANGDLTDFDPAVAGQQDYAAATPQPDSHDDVHVVLLAYDNAGRLLSQTDNAGVTTRFEYDSLGRQVLTTENATANAAEEPDENRTLAVVYEGQRAVRMIAGNLDDASQTTLLEYTDPIDAGRLTEMHYPGQQAPITMSHDWLGRPVTRTDQRGVEVEFTYDAVGRVSLQSVSNLPADVDGHVLSVGYAYDDIGRMQTVTAYAGASGTGAVRNQVLHTYDGWGQVSAIAQAHEGEVDGSTPSVEIAYDATRGTLRRTGLTYPDGRGVRYSYADSGSRDDRLSRVRRITDDASQNPAVYAEYTYLGTRSLLAVGLPGITGGLQLAYGTGGSHGGIDRFGRVVDQAWRRDDDSVADRFRYGYDRVGNPLWRQAAHPQADQLDELYVYDALHRLVDSRRGNLTFDPQGTAQIAAPARNQAWTLDQQGNWRTFLEQIGGVTAVDQTRGHTLSNAISGIGAQGGAPVWVTPQHDAAGNMILAPSPARNEEAAAAMAQHYRYDAWGRLVQVHRDDGDNTQTVLPGNGQLDLEDSLLAAYRYDGLGRRIARLVPNGTNWDRTDYYYNDRWQVLEERSASGLTNDETPAADTSVQYVWCLRHIDSPILRDRDADGDGGTGTWGASTGLEERLYYLTDATANVTAVVTPTGDVVERYTYDAYGRVTFHQADWSLQQVAGRADGTASAVDNEILYAGYRHDPQTDLYHVRYRHYHPALGRWMVQDPSGYVDGMNLYQYCRSAPTRYGDSTGLASVDLVTVIHWDFSQKRTAFHNPVWWLSYFRTKNRARFDVDDCCQINPLPDSDESQAGFRRQARPAGTNLLWPMDFSGHTKAKYWKATLECTCNGRRVDGLWIEVWHAFSSKEAAQITLNGGLEVEFGKDGAKAKGVIGGQIAFAPGTQLSRARWVFLACPDRDSTHYWATVRLITAPNNGMTHSTHRVGRHWWRLGWTTQNIAP